MLTNILSNTHTCRQVLVIRRPIFVLGQKMAVETCLIDLVQL